MILLHVHAAYTVFLSQRATGLNPWPINLGNGELGQTQFLEREREIVGGGSKRMGGEA